MADVVLTSVPATERALAEELFPRARIEPRAAQDIADAEARVLVVSYADRLVDLRAFPRVRAIVTRSDGYDHLPAVEGVDCYHLAGYATTSVAHHALMMLLALLHRVPEGASRTREGSWSRADLVGRHLGDVTVGVLGAGRIGSEVARLVEALGGHVLAYDIRSTAHLPMASSLDALLAASDALTVHVPLGPSTRGMLGARELALLPRGAVLVNTARGEVVDARAVADALAGGQLAGFAADVLPGEPAPAEALELLAGRPDVLLTPHTAAYDARTVRERYVRSARIADALLAGRDEEVAEYRVLTSS